MKTQTIILVGGLLVVSMVGLYLYNESKKKQYKIPSKTESDRTELGDFGDSLENIWDSVRNLF